MKQQDILRKQVKLAKACTDWLTFKDLAATLDITDHSFYNWLNAVESPIIHTSKHAEWSTSNTQIIPSGAEFKYDFELEYTYDD